MIECTTENRLIAVFFFNDTATTEIYTLSLHDALPISVGFKVGGASTTRRGGAMPTSSTGGADEGAGAAVGSNRRARKLPSIVSATWALRFCSRSRNCGVV